LIDSRPVIAWNVVAVGVNFLTVGAYFYFSSHEKNRNDTQPDFSVRPKNQERRESVQ
jgi:hypothetical protein